MYQRLNLARELHAAALAVNHEELKRDTGETVNIGVYMWFNRIQKNWRALVKNPLPAMITFDWLMEEEDRLKSETGA
jgi:hypothetical protein